MEKKKENKALFIIGSLALVVVAAITVPKIIDCASSFVYKKQPRKVSVQDDDWGPEIVRKMEET